MISIYLKREIRWPGISFERGRNLHTIYLSGKIDLSSYLFTINGSIFPIGTFLNTVVSFIIITLVVFFLIVRPIAKPGREKKEGTGSKSA